MTRRLRPPAPLEVRCRPDGLPVEIRRTAREKYQALLRTLYNDGLHAFYRDGQIRWPKSIEDEIRHHRLHPR